jgi:propanol-preferring alcohol dehydrogenase
MRAMVLEAPGQALVEREVPDPVADAGQTVIDVLGCGVCHSDVHVVEGHIGRTPVILGHEVVGVDAQLGPVMVYAPWGCRRPDCLPCSSGQEMICPNSHEAGIVENGGYADKMLIPHRDYLVPLGDVDPLEVAPLACGGLTAYRAVRRATSRWAGQRSGRTLVVGAGGLGQYAVQLLARLDGSHVTVADTLAARRELAVDLGADATTSLDDVDPESFDSIIDFVGTDNTLASAARSIRRDGVVTLVGMFGGAIPFGLGRMPSEAWLTTSIWGTPDDLRALLALNDSEPLRHVVEHLPLSEANTAHELLRNGQSKGRIVLTVA